MYISLHFGDFRYSSVNLYFGLAILRHKALVAIRHFSREEEEEDVIKLRSAPAPAVIRLKKGLCSHTFKVSN